jgi:hypothetical protein
VSEWERGLVMARHILIVILKKSVIAHPWLLNMPKIISIPLNIIYGQKPFVTLKNIMDEAMDGNYPLQFNRIDFLSKYLLAK